MKKITLVDGNSILFRAYYATAYPGANILQTKDGQYTNAVFAFANLIGKILEQSDNHILIAFDTKEKTHRHDAFKDYKAGRKEMPEELASQLALVHELIELLGIKEFSQAGYEADDIIGSLAKKAQSEGYYVDIYSSDRDLLQLVDKNITVHLLKKGMKEVDHFTPESFETHYGIKLEQFIDLKALMGDQSDNIPGIPGVGEKTAVKLLNEYGSLDNIIEKRFEIKGKLGENIQENYEKALLSRSLSTIHTNMELPFEIKDTELKTIDEEALISFLQRLELKQLAIQFRKRVDKTTKDTTDFQFEVLENETDIKEKIKGPFSLYFEFSDFNYHKAELWGIGLSNGMNHYFIDKDTLLNSDAFKTYLSNNDEKYVHNYKAIIVYLNKHGLKINHVVYDFLLAAYIIKSSIGKEDFTVVAQLFNVHDLQYDEEIYGKGAKKGLPEDKTLYQSHIVKKAFTIFQLKDETLNILKEREQTHLLNDVELPLSEVLASMEIEGIYVDKDEILRQTESIIKRIENLRTKIIELAGVEFNVDSPKQLGDILFETLGLPNGKKTKTGFSTDVEVLNSLVGKHDIIPYILEYRQLTKLHSTYLVGIKDSIFDDGKIHTIYNQALTVTGRLSSLEPNLQNIPIRTEEGREIRKIFVAKENHNFVGADYSQIELRVLAEVANVKNLQQAFDDNLDIHKSTAQKVFHVDQVDSEQRRRAKAVNFGIIYGIGAFSLAQDINVSRKEAEQFIERYLEVYPEIKEYMKNIVEFAKVNGYVETILKRRRYIPEISSSVFNIREFGKRTALNAPIQGSAADIIKLAMIKLHQYLIQNHKQSKLILQVHDELILEVPNEEVDEMKKIVPSIMQNAYKMKVKLESSCDVGKTWYDLK